MKKAHGFLHAPYQECGALPDLNRGPADYEFYVLVFTLFDGVL
jgi:hypothetical protein